MRKHAATFLLAFFGGALVGWFANGTFGRRAESGQLNDPKILSAPLSNAGQALSNLQSSPDVSVRSSELGAKSAKNSVTAAANGGVPMVGTNRSPTMRTNTGDSLAPTGSGIDSNANSNHLDSDNQARQTPLQDLLNANNLGCTFGAGNSAEWPGGKIRIGGASWQGGPVELDAVNIDAGTAQMVGSGVTRMGVTTIAVTVTATDSGLNFSGVVGHGALVVISVFAALDGAGHHIAVMSSHGLVGGDSAQFYGSCKSGTVD